MIESASLFVAILLSLALIKSLYYNPRRLEAIEYSFSILFFQLLVAGYEDIFFICPQFPIFISPLDETEEAQDPDKTMADPEARGVYVDTALVLARCTSPSSVPIATTFTTAFRRRNLDLFNELYISGMEAPILEERKRCPTRHHSDLEDYCGNIRTSLGSAEVQVVTQARILFASPRFSDQDFVILLATAGCYYRVAAIHRDHPVNYETPSNFDVYEFFKRAEIDSTLDPTDTDTLVNSATIRKGRHQLSEARKKAEKERQDRARTARAAGRDARNSELRKLTDDPMRDKSNLVLSVGIGPYTDKAIEQFYALSSGASFYRTHLFFEPEPLPNQNLFSLFPEGDPTANKGILFTGVIRIGTPVSDKYIGLIRDYLAGLAAAEKRRRAD